VNRAIALSALLGIATAAGLCWPPAPVPEACPDFAPDACDLCVSDDDAPIESCRLPCACEVTR
jgi:hypothetical protein